MVGLYTVRAVDFGVDVFLKYHKLAAFIVLEIYHKLAYQRNNKQHNSPNSRLTVLM